MGFGVVGAVLYILLSPGFYLHRCNNGQPETHLYLSLFVISTLLLFIRQGRARVCTVLVMCFLTWLPAYHFNTLVHGGQFIGTTNLQHVYVSEGREPVKALYLWHSRFTHLYALQTRQVKPEEAVKDNDPIAH